MDGALKETVPTYPIFLEAANILREKGWIRYRTSSPSGYCLMGAVFEAWGDTCYTGLYPILEVLSNKIYEKKGRFGIASWNDSKCTSKEEAIEILEETAYYGKES